MWHPWFSVNVKIWRRNYTNLIWNLTGSLIRSTFPSEMGNFIQFQKKILQWKLYIYVNVLILWYRGKFSTMKIGKQKSRILLNLVFRIFIPRPSMIFFARTIYRDYTCYLHLRRNTRLAFIPAPHGIHITPGHYLVSLHYVVIDRGMPWSTSLERVSSRCRLEDAWRLTRLIKDLIISRQLLAGSKCTTTPPTLHPCFIWSSNCNRDRIWCRKVI